MSSEISSILLDQADRLFAQHVTRERLADADAGHWPEALWQAVEAAGLPLALVAEEAGGAGLAAADGMTLLRRAGYHTVPLPLAETMLAAHLWAAAGGAVPEGPITLGPCNVSDTLALERAGTGFSLRGRLHRVPWGEQAGHVLVHARDAGGAAHLALLERAPAGNAQRRNLALEPRATLDLDGVALAADAVRMAPALAEGGLLELGALARAQQMVGAMERCLDYGLTYANERKQFGRPIGKFQAVQHMLAIAAGHYAAAAAAADFAAQAWGSARFGFAVAVAKARAGEAAGAVAEAAHQVHGAMGFTQEHPLHFATRRLWSWRDEFGHEALWQERIGREVCAAGGAALWPMLVGA